MSPTDDTRTRTITLTDRPPVQIVQADWPVIARDSQHDGREFECQANRWWWITVRRHADGRTIVYGRSDSNWQGEHSQHAGYLMHTYESLDVVRAIHDVSEAIDAPKRMAGQVIAELPAEVL